MLPSSPKSLEAECVMGGISSAPQDALFLGFRIFFSYMCEGILTLQGTQADCGQVL